MEEACISPLTIKHVANLSFTFPPILLIKPMIVYTFVAYNFTGILAETEEMAPRWFAIQDIPYQNMWESDQYWLPHVLAGKFINAEFKFDQKDHIIGNNVHLFNL